MDLIILGLIGPNLNLLGLREPELYGREDYAALERFIRAAAQEAGAAVTIRQSNFEGELVTWVQQAHGVFDGLVINAAAYSHTSVALLDALKAVRLLGKIAGALDRHGNGLPSAAQDDRLADPSSVQRNRPQTDRRLHDDPQGAYAAHADLLPVLFPDLRT